MLLRAEAMAPRRRARAEDRARGRNWMTDRADPSRPTLPRRPPFSKLLEESAPLAPRGSSSRSSLVQHHRPRNPPSPTISVQCCLGFVGGEARRALPPHLPSRRCARRDDLLAPPGFAESRVRLGRHEPRVHGSPGCFRAHCTPPAFVMIAPRPRALYSMCTPAGPRTPAGGDITMAPPPARFMAAGFFMRGRCPCRVSIRDPRFRARRSSVGAAIPALLTGCRACRTHAPPLPPCCSGLARDSSFMNRAASPMDFRPRPPSEDVGTTRVRPSRAKIVSRPPTRSLRP